MKSAHTDVEYGADDDKELSKEFGILLYTADQSGGYDTDAAVLYKKGRNYTLLEASSCSCYEAVYDGWTYTKQELLKWAEKRSDGYGAEKEMAQWINENLN